MADQLLANLKANRDDPDAYDAEKFERDRRAAPSARVAAKKKAP